MSLYKLDDGHRGGQGGRERVRPLRPDSQGSRGDGGARRRGGRGGRRGGEGREEAYVRTVGRYPLCPGPSVPAKRGRQPGDPLTPRTAKRGPGGGTESEGEPSEMPSRGPGGASRGGSVPQTPLNP